MKNVAVFFKKPGAKDYPFTDPEYWSSYQALDREIQKAGGRFFIVRDNSTYRGHGRFSRSWQFQNGDLAETGAVTIDRIYDKGEFKSDGNVSILNHAGINEICTDKWKTYQLFNEFCAQTFLATDETEFHHVLSRLNGAQKVVKPVDGEGGEGVYIGDDAYLKTCPRLFPVLVQEFLDTHEGIPGIYKGTHDFRVVFINNEIIYAFYRTPPQGKLLANVARGGSLTLIPIKDIPPSVLKIADAVRRHFTGDYYFGLDVGFVQGIPKIIELNSRLALFSPERGQPFSIFTKKIADLLTREAD